MVKRDSGLARTARLLDLVPYLTTHQGVAISELAKTFKTTVKEITDDLNTLWMCGLPGYTPLELIDLEFESGFVSIRNAETLATPRALDRAEALSIYMGLDLLSAELTDESLASEISKLQDQLRSQLVFTPKVQIEANLASDSRALLLKAIRRRGWVEITYHSVVNDEVTLRQIAPYELSQSGTHEYLQGYCAKAKAIRNFRADRIDKVIEINDQQWPDSEISDHEKQQSFQIKVHQEARQIHEVMPQIPVGVKSGEVLSYSTNWLARSVLSLGGRVEVTAPDEARAEIRRRAAAALRNYQ